MKINAVTQECDVYINKWTRTRAIASVEMYNKKISHAIKAGGHAAGVYIII
jgi:hypothetical protein